MTLETMKAKMELKELVDTFSILAEEKDTKTQAQLFTENAVLTSYRNGEVISKQTGREKIEHACQSFLSLFDIVYHMNGQQVVQVEGEKAKGKSYCMVMLIGKNEEGKTVKNLQGVWYEDEYAKEEGKWKIAARNSYFTWNDSKTED